MSLPQGRIRGQILALTPERMPEHCTIASTREAVRQFFDATYLRGDEGLVVKDPYSQWVVGDMSGSWTKVKPDFNYTYEYDVVIVGARYGTHMGSRGELNNYIVAIRERMPEETGPDAPLTFLTFARVSNGFCVEDRCEGAGWRLWRLRRVPLTLRGVGWMRGMRESG